MNLSDLGLQAIRDSEALRLYAYPDPASQLANATPREPWGFKPAPEILAGLPMQVQILHGKPWTIGYGMTRFPDGRHVIAADTCTRDEAEVWLRVTVAPYERAVAEAVKVIINQRMFDALVSLAYNIGEHAFRSSGLVRRLNEWDYIGAQAEFDRWVKAGGRVVAGLVKRRDLEQAMFNEGIREALADQPDALAQFNALVNA